MQWSSYAVSDFIPFTQEVYLRLLERVNEAFWPWQPALVLVGFALPLLLWRGHLRLATALLSLLWAWVAFNFFSHYYAPLNWAGSYGAWAFYLQAVLLSLLSPARSEGAASLALSTGQSAHTQQSAKIRLPVQAAVGLGLCLLSACWPLISWLLRGEWVQAEVVGLHPDITAGYTLGFALLLLHGWRLSVAVIIPLIWCLFSALTLGVFELPQRYWLYLVVVLTLAMIIAGELSRRSPADHYRQ